LLSVPEGEQEQTKPTMSAAARDRRRPVEALRPFMIDLKCPELPKSVPNSAGALEATGAAM
jgi:hypothetical protein